MRMAFKLLDMFGVLDSSKEHLMKMSMLVQHRIQALRVKKASLIMVSQAAINSINPTVITIHTTLYRGVIITQTVVAIRPLKIEDTTVKSMWRKSMCV